MSIEAKQKWPGLGKSAFAALFVVGGVGHFVAPHLYLSIMPPYLPSPRFLVLLSGFFEIVLGVALLVPRTSRVAAWGLIALLIAVFPANAFMYQHAARFGLPRSVLLVRLPVQGLLIVWAYRYTRRRDEGKPSSPRRF